MNLRSPQPEREALFDFGHDGRTDPATDLETTLSRLQRAVGANKDVAMPTSLKHALWEDLMNAHAAATAALPPAGGLNPVIGSGQRTLTTVTHRPLRSRWTIGINTLLAAALILALGGGIWRVAQIQGIGPFGNGPEPSSIPFGSFAQDDGSIDPTDLPTAEDCTVEPLTVDEVLWYVTDTYEASYAVSMEDPGPAPTEIVPATPPATNQPNYEPHHASAADLQAAADVQFMLTACVMANSYFQVWALLSPSVVAADVQSVLPPLTGEDEARTLLTALEENGPSEGWTGNRDGVFPPVNSAALYAPSNNDSVWLLDTNPENSWQNAPGLLTAGYTTYNLDGSLAQAPVDIFHWGDGTPVTTIQDTLFIEYFNCSFTFTWHEGRQMWLVEQGVTCMG